MWSSGNCVPLSSGARDVCEIHCFWFWHPKSPDYVFKGHRDIRSPPVSSYFQFLHTVMFVSQLSVSCGYCQFFHSVYRFFCITMHIYTLTKFYKGKSCYYSMYKDIEIPLVFFFNWSTGALSTGEAAPSLTFSVLEKMLGGTKLHGAAVPEVSPPPPREIFKLLTSNLKWHCSHGLSCLSLHPPITYSWLWQSDCLRSLNKLHDQVGIWNGVLKVPVQLYPGP